MLYKFAVVKSLNTLIDYLDVFTVSFLMLKMKSGFVLFFLHLQLTMNDFSVHRIIGRGGFGEVYGCRKADTGKM